MPKDRFNSCTTRRRVVIEKTNLGNTLYPESPAELGSYEPCRTDKALIAPRYVLFAAHHTYVYICQAQISRYPGTGYTHETDARVFEAATDDVANLLLDLITKPAQSSPLQKESPHSCLYVYNIYAAVSLDQPDHV